MFNTLSEDLVGFREKIKPGAFNKTIKKADVRALFNHDEHYVLGRTKSGTLKLIEDDHGLRMENIPPDTQWAKDLLVSIERGDINQMSFGFRVISDRWETKDEEPIRILEKVELVDVSPVTFPAYPDTEVALRSMERWQENLQPPAGTSNGDQDEPSRRKVEVLKRSLDLRAKLINREV